MDGEDSMDEGEGQDGKSSSSSMLSIRINLVLLQLSGRLAKPMLRAACASAPSTVTMHQDSVSSSPHAVSSVARWIASRVFSRTG